jgi:AcrR family transcriptional regulator
VSLDTREPRERILDAAAALFTEHGYAGTSTRAVAERAGIREASLYYHFAGKSEIRRELVEASVRPSPALVDALRDGGLGDSAAALYALAAADVDALLTSPLDSGWGALAHTEEPPFADVRDHRRQLLAAYSALAAAIRPGEDAAFLGACCLQLVELVVVLRREGELGPDPADRIARACLRVVGVTSPAAVPAGQELRRRAAALQDA